MRLCLTEKVAESYGDRIREILPEIDVVQMHYDGTLSSTEGGIEAFFLSEDSFAQPRERQGPLREARARLAEDPAFRWFHTCTAGYDNPFFQSFIDRGVTLTNSPGLHARPMAEWVMGAILVHAKNHVAHQASQVGHEWNRVRSAELTGQTVGVVGMGGIGLEVARLAKAFEMRVIGTKRSALRHEHVDTVLPPDRLGELLAESDYVVLAAPLTDATRGMLGTAEFAAMKPSATLINVARGALIDEAALIEALRAGEIAGASLDVASQEPLPPDAALWDAPNCLITPHISQGSPHSMSRTSEHFLENLGRFGRGEPLLNVVHDTELTAS
jgi:phosphoglycerate dehydrogenase-like enzyme